MLTCIDRGRDRLPAVRDGIVYEWNTVVGRRWILQRLRVCQDRDSLYAVHLDSTTRFGSVREE